MSFPNLRCHVKVRAACRWEPELVDVNNTVLVFVPSLLRVSYSGTKTGTHFAQSEICHFQHRCAGTLRDEDIIWFKVSVNNVVFVQERHSATQLHHEAGIGSGIGPSWQNELIQIPSLAKLHNKPQVAGLIWTRQYTLTYTNTHRRKQA